MIDNSRFIPGNPAPIIISETKKSKNSIINRRGLMLPNDTNVCRKQLIITLSILNQAVPLSINLGKLCPHIVPQIRTILEIYCPKGSATKMCPMVEHPGCLKNGNENQLIINVLIFMNTYFHPRSTPRISIATIPPTP